MYLLVNFESLQLAHPSFPRSAQWFNVERDFYNKYFMHQKRAWPTWRDTCLHSL